MTVGVLEETYPGERRVALIPLHAAEIRDAGFEVVVQSGAGIRAGYPDRDYREKGARLAGNPREVYREAGVLLRVCAAGANPRSGIEEIALMKEGGVLVGFLDPYASRETLDALNRRRITSFAMELIPRITRAQKMDALSSMASLAGYRAALLAACALPRVFPMMMTAAGTVLPARVFVVGAGVAGLQAIATAHRIGAVVTAYDVRPAAREQVESLGARFVDLGLDTAEAEDSGGYARQMDEGFYRRQREMMERVLAGSDVVITTAAVPGKKAPLLITREMARLMPPGSVIVDLAAEQGGNCEATVPGETVQEGEVRVLGPVNLPSAIPFHASQLYSKNISSFFMLMAREGCLDLDCEDEIARESRVTAGGELVNPRVREALWTISP
ncbi:MAG: Re/Si-specific NAD(P)(+) transhydrogenase subunit alpha [Spirochaetota bacterium]